MTTLLFAIATLSREPEIYSAQVIAYSSENLYHMAEGFLNLRSDGEGGARDATPGEEQRIIPLDNGQGDLGLIPACPVLH